MASAQQQQPEQMAAPAAPPSPIPAVALTLPVLLAERMDVTRYLSKYLKPREQRRLLNTSRQMAEMKQHLLYWKLTQDQCRIFYAQPSFRSQLEALVHDPSLQQCLRFEGGNGITDVSSLRGVHALTLARCPGITDVSCLGTVHTLTLQSCSGITDVSCLGTVHTLPLWLCRGITDMSALDSVHALCLSCCYQIADVSALDGVHTLTLDFCEGITDVGALGSVHTLTLRGCPKITDVGPLGSVHTLCLGDCPVITDVSALGVHVYEIVTSCILSPFPNSDKIIVLSCHCAHALKEFIIQGKSAA
jgi:hypothetical protein